MAIKSLAVKYRPTTFNDVTEQGSIKVILEQQLESNTTKNAYLFCGGAGTGKTTCARIFAGEINKHQGNPIEMDAASNSSVDDVREIISQAKTKSLDSEYKVFIIDECFPGNTLINTSSVPQPISSICVGDVVESMSGNHTVTQVFKTRVLTDRLCCVTINNKKVITTVEHLFFTNAGWIEASKLREGDIVYGSENLRELRQRVCETTGQRYEILLKQLCESVSVQEYDKRAETASTSGDTSLPSLRKTLYRENYGQAKDLLKEVRNNSRCEVIYTVDEYRIWDGETETIIRKNVDEQSNVQSGYYRQDVGNEGEKRYSTSVSYKSGWKWEIYDSTDRLVESLRKWLGTGISYMYKESGLARNEITLVLQSRPWLFSEEVSSRGRWSRTQLEKFLIEGCKENTSTGVARVESVEIYKRGNNDELFRSSFSDTELSSGYVTMYDLEVDGDHSYFANNTLVHNCHSLSNTAWQSFLKLIEEPPAKSIFIFCTTDPQKIPKTILSRVQRYDFQRISMTGIKNRLEDICDYENRSISGEFLYKESDLISYDSISLEYIAKLADGGMRDAITLLDKCISFSKDVTLENVTKALGVVDYKVMCKLTDAIINSHNKSVVIKVIEEVHKSGKDLKQFIKSYMNFVLDINKYNCLKSFDYLEVPPTYESDFKELFNNIELCNSLLGTLIKLNSEIKWETAPKSMIEASLILQCEEK